MARKMKNSGVEWIGEIPEEWNLVKVKNLFNIGRGRVIAKTELEDEGYPVYSSQTKDNGVLGYISTYDFDRSQLTWTTDGANAGTVFLREGKHNCTNVCGTLMPKEDSNNLKYMKYALEFIAIYHKRADTNGFKIMNNEMAEIKITIPPVTVQQKIADFLDEKVGEIDTIIAKTKQSIEEYKKYKQAVITETVTKGLDESVEMKDSGIEWIGKIPRNWKTIKIKYTSWLKGRIGWQGLKSDEYQDEGAYLITGTDFYNGAIKWESCVHISDNRFAEAPEIHIKEDDLLITKDGTIGKVAIAKNCPEKVSLNSGVLLIRNTKVFKYYDKYLYFVLLSDQFWKWYERSQTGNSTIKHLYQEQFYNFEFTFPKIEEQQRIAEYLKKKVTEIDALITKKESFIEEMETYKKSLIYEYVTGKKEVPV